MEAKENKFRFMAAEDIIEIPFFQRAYVWEEKQWKQLFDDLKISFDKKKEHFLDSIVLKQLQTNVGEGTKRSLIDGQQRLTTFSILVKSLCDTLENDKINYEILLYKDLNKKTPKIQHSKIDGNAFNRILQAKNYKDIKLKRSWNS